MPAILLRRLFFAPKPRSPPPPLLLCAFFRYLRAPALRKSLAQDADISIRRRALDLLFVMADETNGTVIVEELVTYLGSSGAAIREEMVLKIAILAEKFTDDLNWWVVIGGRGSGGGGGWLAREVARRGACALVCAVVCCGVLWCAVVCVVFH